MVERILLRLEDTLWALYASGVQPGDESNVHLDNLALAYAELDDCELQFRQLSPAGTGSDLLDSIEAACAKLEASLPRVAETLGDR